MFKQFYFLNWQQLVNKLILFFCVIFFQANANAEIIRINCASKVIDYSFVVVVDTQLNTVRLNDNTPNQKNVRISNSQIYFEMEIPDKKSGDYFSHTINRASGVMALKIEPNGKTDYYQCSKVINNKF
ncbi:hypothetical protein G6677_00225 [Polynucleobacter paneuropaeus]|nr:hypothetical protein [Polynucleobacter paneuropaeus]